MHKTYHEEFDTDNGGFIMIYTDESSVYQ